MWEALGGSARLEVVSAVPLAPTLAAPALALRGVCGQCVPLATLGAASELGHDVLASQGVLPARHGLEVARIAAGALAAEVVEDQPVGDGAHECLVGNAVGVANRAGDLDAGVARVSRGAIAYPARGLVA